MPSVFSRRLRPWLLAAAGSWCTAGQAQTYYGVPVVPLSNTAPPTFPDDVRRYVAHGDEGVAFYRDMLLFSEPSTVAPYGADHNWQRTAADQKRMFVLNADVRPAIALGGRVPRLGHFYLPKLGRFVQTLHVVPRFRVRIFQDDSVRRGDYSLPVRTPSYMPGLQYFVTPAKLWRASRPTKWYGTFYAYHHSDGQDGPEFYPADSLWAKQGAVNTYNGNFSELVVFEAGIGGTYTQRKRVLSSSGDLIRGRDSAQVAAEEETARTSPWRSGRQTRNGRRIWYWQALYEWHGKHLTNREYARYQVYGRHRLNLRGAYLFAPEVRSLLYSNSQRQYYATTPFRQVERHRFILNASYILDNHYRTGPTIYALRPVDWFDLGKRLNVDLTYHWRIAGTAHTSLFAQVGYYGSDPYNVYFQQSMWLARAGLALGFFRYEVQPVLAP